MPSSASVFGGNTVCLRTMGEQIVSRRQLYNLCLVSKLFNKCLSPFLYNSIAVKTHRDLVGLLESQYLSHATAFTGLGDFRSWDDEAEEEPDLIPQLMSQLANIEVFRWSAPLTQERLDAVSQSCSKLKSVSIRYPEDLEENELELISEVDDEDQDFDEDVQWARDKYMLQDVSVFTNLQALTITDIYGDLAHWRSQLVQVLVSSPHLTHLRLGLARHAVERNCCDGRPELHMNFFDELCDEFAETGTSPLQFRSLRCGSAIFPTNLQSLERLTDLACLEEFHAENRDIATHSVWLSVYGDDGTSRMILDSILSPRCPRLRWFSAFELRKDIFDALRSAQASSITPGLGISFECRDFRRGEGEIWELLRQDPNHPTLPLKLRMMDVGLDRIEESEHSVSSILADLVASNAETLEGLAVHLPTTQTGVSSLDSLQRALQGLPRLTQLVIIPESGRTGPRPEDDVLAGAVETLARAVPQLRYVGVRGMYWRIWRTGVSDASTNLEKLEERSEWEHVELFRHTAD